MPPHCGPHVPGWAKHDPINPTLDVVSRLSASNLSLDSLDPARVGGIRRAGAIHAAIDVACELLPARGRRGIRSVWTTPNCLSIVRREVLDKLAIANGTLHVRNS